MAYGRAVRGEDAVAPGSHVQLTRFLNAVPEAAALEQVPMAAVDSGRIRGREEITRFFDRLELAGPGVVFVLEWRPDATVRYPREPSAQLMLGGLGSAA